MHALPISSPPSAPCRLEWRPSRWLLAALALLSVLAPLSILGSDMPRACAWPAAALAALYAAWLLRREARQAPRALLIPTQGNVAASVDGQAVAALQVDWRGPLAFARWRDADGHVRRLAWWPDTLPPAARRELRLAAQARAASSAPPQMAP
ncbi:toxin CptA [Xanthomonas translucens]